jgi:ABC-type Zn uptake system ZnuABC Zn-binding protein ZnuA
MTIAATSNPVAAIIREIAGTKINVITLLPAGASPHTYSPKPADIYKVQSSDILFSVADNLDGWAAKLPVKNKIKLLDMLPDSLKLSYGNMNKGDEEGYYDPHFWTDPLTVKAIISKIADTLSALSPSNASSFKANAKAFEKRLDLLNHQIEDITKNIKGRPVFLFHPSFRYFIKRYGLVYEGSLEPSPGKEPSPKFIIDLVKKINESGAKSIFSEPQLPEGPAKTLSEAAVVNVYILDPIGGIKGRESYSDLMMYNARIFQQALE